MPRPSVNTAASVKAGFVRHCRSANVMSWRNPRASRAVPRFVALPANAGQRGCDAPALDAPLGRPARFRRIHAAVDQLLGAQFDMMRELVLHFLLDRHAPQQRTQALSNGHDWTA
jgi:hypothetical protein